MRSQQIMIAFLLLLAFLAVATSARADEEATKKAVAAAETWLKLIDHGEFGKSWETAAALFKGAVTEEQWNQQMTGLRQPLGKRIFREVVLTKYETSIPGAPDGEYVIVHFKAAFENKINAEETVTPMRDPDGEWRVAGYYLK